MCKVCLKHNVPLTGEYELKKRRLRSDKKKDALKQLKKDDPDVAGIHSCICPKRGCEEKCGDCI